MEKLTDKINRAFACMEEIKERKSDAENRLDILNQMLEEISKGIESIKAEISEFSTAYENTRNIHIDARTRAISSFSYRLRINRL